MKIEIKLKDPKYCGGCPLLTFASESGFTKPHRGPRCLAGQKIVTLSFPDGFGELSTTLPHRPQECVRRFGE